MENGAERVYGEIAKAYTDMTAECERQFEEREKDGGEFIMNELSIPEHLKKKGITSIKYSKRYGIIMMKGKRFLFDIFESWGDTQSSLHESLGDLDGDHETRYDIMLLLMLEHEKRGKLRRMTDGNGERK